jgi:hypothetical protein
MELDTYKAERMKEEKYKWILTSLIIMLAIIGWFGMFWTLSLSHITITHEFKMDDNTRDYLLEHDYCVQMQSPQYESNESTNMFIGDCEYLDYEIFR